jgi:beta-glucosidase
MNEAAPTQRFRDTSLSFEERVDDLLNQLTLEERCSQLTYESPAIERLGIPAYNWWNECLHGVGRAGLATVFPQAIGLAATFDVDLMHRVAIAISDEARAKHHAHAARGDFGIYKGLTHWTPNINIFRDPRWGRGHETYGECPYLTGRMGVAFVTGLQGDDARYLKLVATPKHMAVHSGPEQGRHGFDAVVSNHDLYETYLPAFRATVMEGKAFSVMGAYNRLNGVPCCANDFLLNQCLREKWGFDGYTVSDCGAIADIHAHHKVTATAAESAALAISNGLDLCCGNDYRQLMEALRVGLVNEAIIDRSVCRLMMARFKLGMFDPPEHVSHTRIPYEVVDCDQHRALALQAARESIVLLKNAGELLPLSKTLRNVAVIGPNADARQVLLGNYHGTPAFTVSPLDGIRTALGPEAKIHFSVGTTHLPTQGSWLGKSTRGFVEAIIAAEQSELTVLCLGLSPTIEGEEGDAMNSDAGGDRTVIELPQVQQDLLEAIVATGKPVVLVLIGGSAMAIPWAQDHVPAILQQFYPGQDGGTALADVLFGDCNPSGRLPITVYRATTDLPPFFDYSMKNRTYRYFEGEALYPFGFGLSYTQFAYSDLQAPLDPVTMGRNAAPVSVSVRVRNTGSRAGAEVVQLYLSHVDPPLTAPRFQLAGVRRIFLERGVDLIVTFELRAEQFALIDEDGTHQWLSGNVRVAVGGSQPDDRSAGLGSPRAATAFIKVIASAG